VTDRETLFCIHHFKTLKNSEHNSECLHVWFIGHSLGSVVYITCGF